MCAKEVAWLTMASMKSSMMGSASAANTSTPTASPTSPAHSMALPRSTACSGPVDSTSSARMPGMKWL